MSGSSGRSILLTGVTGNIGRKLTKELFAQKIPFSSDGSSQQKGWGARWA
jgi:uncharacterized protein YbjT (DUF2867 family)